MPLDEGVFSVSDREPEEGAGERLERDPVNHHPPEEWRPGDPGDPIEGGPQPPGEPEHGFPAYGPPPGGAHAYEPPPGGPHQYGGPSPDQPFSGPSPREPFSGDDYHYGTPAGGQASYGPPEEEGRQYGGLPPGGQPRYEPPEGHPTGGPPEPMDPGELSEGPSGPGGAGYEHSGYAPGYGGYPSEPVEYGPPGGYGGPVQGGYGQPPTQQTPWGKIVGIGCGVLLLLLLVLGGCAALLLVFADSNVPSAGGVPGASQQESDQGEAEPSEAEVTAASTEFEPSSLYVEGDYTSVEVSVTNAGEDALDVNPLYFTVVDADGAEHDPNDAIAMDANELGAQTLDPGQSASGAITVEGEVEPARVLFAPFFTGPVEAPVA